jgi:hypothetical protein
LPKDGKAWQAALDAATTPLESLRTTASSTAQKEFTPLLPAELGVAVTKYVPAGVPVPVSLNL